MGEDIFDIKFATNFNSIQSWDCELLYPTCVGNLLWLKMG